MITCCKNFLVILFFLLNTFPLFSQWVQTNGPAGDECCLAVNGTNIFAGTSSGVYLSTNNGINWTQVNNGLISNYSYIYVRSLFINGTNLFAGIDEGGIFLSTNNGATWTQINNGLTILDTWAFASIGTNIFAATDIGVLLSTNNGTNWTKVNNAIMHYVQAFAVSGIKLFAGDGNYISRAGVYISTNNGTNWTNVGNDMNTTLVQSLSVSGANLFAGTYESGAFLSTNDGNNWIAVNNGLNDAYNFYSLAVSGTNIFAGTDVGMFLSTNNGTNWTKVNDGLPDHSTIYSIAFSETEIYAGVQANYVGAGVWRRPLSDFPTAITKEVNDSPIDYSLSQNYPNPFNPSTTISYRLKESGFVKLNIYDITGKHIQTLVSQTKEPGSYETQFNAQGLASGIYFYRLEVFGKGSSPVFSEMKKLVLLK